MVITWDTIEKCDFKFELNKTPHFVLQNILIFVLRDDLNNFRGKWKPKSLQFRIKVEKKSTTYLIPEKMLHTIPSNMITKKERLVGLWSFLFLDLSIEMIVVVKYHLFNHYLTLIWFHFPIKPSFNLIHKKKIVGLSPLREIHEPKNRFLRIEIDLKKNHSINWRVLK